MKEMHRNCHGHNMSKGNIIKIFYHGLSEITQEVLNAAASGIFLYKTHNQAYQLLKDKVLLKLDWAKNQKIIPSLKKTVSFADEGSSYSDTDKIIARMDAMTLKMDAQYKISNLLQKTKLDLDDDDIPMSREEEAKFMQTFPENLLVEVGKFTFPVDFVILEMEEDSKVPLILGRPFLHNVDAFICVKPKQLNLEVGTEGMIFNIDSAMKHSYSNDDTCFSIDVIDEILEEDFDALLNEGSKIPFEKITINTYYKIKTSLEEPPMDPELNPLLDNLEYVLLEEPPFLPVIISSQLSKEKKNKLVSVLKNHKQAFAWKTTVILEICPSFCKHKIQLLDDKKPVVQKQRWLNPNIPWVSPIHCVPKKGGITVVTKKNDELVPTRTITGWRIQDYALWDVIENGNSFVPVTQTTTADGGAITTTISSPVTAKEKIKKKNHVKARSMLLMALPNEHLMTCNQYKDAKSLFTAIETRFGGNEATKMTQKTLLKKMYENFSAPSTESLDSIFNRLQKIVSQLDVLGEFISHEDLNLKFLRSLPSEWNTHVVKTKKKITINGSDTAGFDKSKVKCYNFPKMGHFAKECREPRNQDSKNRYQDSTRRTVHVEETPPKAMVAIDGVSFDWSYMAEDEVPTNIAFLAFSDSKVYTNNTCSKTYLKSYETLTKQYDDLKIEFNKSKFNLVVYKKGLASIEDQLVFYKNNETTLCENIVVLTRDMSIKDSKINVLKSELEKIKQEKEGIQLKIENFDNASKSLDKLSGSQITEISKNGLGFQSYNIVPPPIALVYNTERCLPPKTDLSYSGLEEFKQPQFESYGPKSCKIKSKNASKDIPNKLKEYPDAPLVKDRVSDNKDCSVESPVVVEKKTFVPTVAKVKVDRPKQQEKPVRKTVRYAEMYRSQGPRRNQRNLNNLKSQQLGSNYVMFNKACFICGSFKHVQANCNYHQRERMVFGNNYIRVTYNNSTRKTHLSAHKKMAPRAVLMKTGLRPLNTARHVNTAHPKTIVYSARTMSRFSKSAQPTVKRPYQQRTTLTNKSISQKVKTTKGKFYTVGPKAVNTARPRPVNTARPNSAVINVVRGHPQKEDQGYVDSGCSRHMTMNMSYLFDFKEFDRGYITFGGGAKGGKFTGKGTFKTASKDETTGILMKFITEIENLIDKKVKVIRCDNGTEFKNSVMNDFCAMKGARPEWLFDIDMLTKSMNYVPVIAGTNSNDFAGLKDSIGAGQSSMKTGYTQDYIFMPLWKDGSPLFDSSLKISGDAKKNHDEVSDKESEALNKLNYAFENLNTKYPGDPKMHGLETIANYNDSEEEADFTNLESSIHVSPTPTTITHKNHPLKQEELLQLKLQKVWILVDLPKGKKSIGTKWVFRNKKDKRGIMIKNKSRLVTQGYTQEESIDYDEVFAPVARIKAIGLFLAYASFMGFMEYHMDMKSAFLYGRIEDEVYVCQPPWFKDHDHPNKVYKVVKALYGLHQALRACTLVDMEKTLVKDADGDDIDVHLYRSMIGSLMYLITSRPDIIYAICVCARFQVTPKVSHLYDVKIIFRYLKGNLKLGLRYPRDSPFELVAYSDSDYAGASLDRKFTTEGCQLLRSRLISRQCKKQTMVTTSTTKAEYVAAASCCRQVLWIQNQMLDYGMVGFGEMMLYNLTTSLQFWQTATATTLNNGEMEITATIDGKVKVVTEASVRRHLKLEDSDGISTFPTTEIFKQLALMGSSIRQETEVSQPSSPPHTHVANEAASTSVDVRHGGAATTVTSLDVGQGSGNINKTPSMPYDSPLPRVHTLRSDEGRMQHNELMDLVTKLPDRVVKKLENIVKTSQARRRAKIIVFDDDDDLEDPSKKERKIEEIDQDPNISLIQHDAEIQGRYSTAEKEVSTVEPVSTAGATVTTASIDVSPASPTRRASIADDITMAETFVYIRRSAAKDKVMRLQEELDEEERQRMASVHEASQSFTKEEWENIRA
nr:reverse transcriptase domain-containing protein [Tanacetum cinerariifolium]